MNTPSEENYTGITFIGGIHGVGKSTFAKKLSGKLGLPHFSCSKLIEDSRKESFSKSKAVANVSANQNDLTSVLNIVRNNHPSFLLDGHFCLLDSDSKITQISVQTFSDINPQRIIVLSTPAELIKVRRPEMRLSIEEIDSFQKAEIEYARDIATMLQIGFILFTYNEASQDFQLN